MKVIPFAEEDLDPVKPPIKIKTSNNVGKKECIALTHAQEEELIAVAERHNTMYALMIELALNTGLRVDELVNLIISDLNLDKKNPEIYVHDRGVSKYHDSFKCKSFLSNRHIPLPLEKDSNLVVKLRASIGNRKTGYVFESQVTQINGEIREFLNLKKNSLIGVLNEYAKECKTIGKNIGFHSTRRTYASKLLDANITIPQIMLVMGHSDLSTTIKYLRTIRKLNQEEIRNGLRRYQNESKSGVK
jgi:integrase